METEEILSPAEILVYRLKKKGYSRRAIARTLNLSINTVKHHIFTINQKIRIKCKTEKAHQSET